MHKRVPDDSAPHNAQANPKRPKPAGLTYEHLWSQRRLANFDYSNRDHACFVTVRALEGTSPFTDDRLAREVVASLEWLRKERNLLLYVYCVMPDHLHLLFRLGAADSTISSTLHTLKGLTTKRSWGLGHTGQLWQSRFYEHVLRKSEDGVAIAEYIAGNPVRSGLAHEASKYPYSGFPDAM